MLPHILLYTGYARLLPQDVATDGREQMTNGRAPDADKQAHEAACVGQNVYATYGIWSVYICITYHVFIYINQFSIAYPDICPFAVACPIWYVQII